MTENEREKASGSFCLLDTLDVDKETARMLNLYGENKRITDDHYDKSLAVKCVNGTFVGKKSVFLRGKYELNRYADKLLKHDNNWERRVAYVGFS